MRYTGKRVRRDDHPLVDLLAVIVWAALIGCVLTVRLMTPRQTEEPVETPVEVEIVEAVEYETPRRPYWMRDDLPVTDELQRQLYDACDEFGVPYELALAVIRQETGFRNVVGDNGNSLGYMQIQPKWWSGLMTEIGAVDLMNPRDNFRTGCAILGDLLDRYSMEDALSVYNTGEPGHRAYSSVVYSQALTYLGDTLLRIQEADLE